MKAKKNIMPWILPFVAGSLTLSSALAQQASTTEWNADPETPGDWEDATWSDGVPGAGSLAGILNGGTVDITSPTAILEQLHLSGGSTLNIEAILDIEGSNQIVNPEPDPATPATGLIVNDGRLNVTTGGELMVDVGGEFVIGRSAMGTMTLGPGGTITTDRRLVLGHSSGNGIFTQTGGDVTATTALGAGTVVVGEGGNATYNLVGGTLTTNNRIRLGVGGGEPRTQLFDQTGGEVYVGDGGSGRIDIGENAVNTSTYAISDGTLTTTGRVLCGAHGDGKGIFEVSGFATVELFGLWVGHRPTTNGMVEVSDEAQVVINQFEVRNGTVTQSGEFSLVDVTGRFFIGSAEVSNLSTSGSYTLMDGTLRLFNTDIRIGYRSTSDATLNIEGGTLETSSRLRVGVGEPDGSFTPTNLVNQTGGEVRITGRLDLGENPGPDNIYEISGGILTATGNVLVGYLNDGVGTFTVDGTAEVDVPAVVMGENAGTNNVTGTRGTVKLLGGVLTTSQIRVGNGVVEDQALILDGGTMRARTDGSTLIAGNVTNASLLAGGITFDTDGFNVSTAGIMTGPGGITKTGGGTLTVNGVQAYTGATRVEDGTLHLTQPYLADNGALYLTTGAVLELDYLDTDIIGTLYIDGEAQPDGTYGGSNTGADTELAGLMTGTGVLNAISSGTPAEPPAVTSITVAGDVATITIHGAPNTTYVCRFSDDLVTPFGPITTDPETITTDGNGDATFTVDASVDRRFYQVGGVE